MSSAVMPPKPAGGTAEKKLRRVQDRWELLSAEIDAASPLLTDQGCLVLKLIGTNRYWYLRYLLPADDRGHRRHRSLYVGREVAQTLNAIIRLPMDNRLPKDVWTMLRAMGFLALLPAVDASRLIDLSNDKRPVISESAIRALGRLDAGQGLPTLVAALGDERARVAIYALRQGLADLPATRVIADLRDAPMNKVTVAKETVRLVGEFGGAAGFEWMVALARLDLHRDVRIAVLRGLWDHLEHPETWTLLAEAAQSTDGQILNGVVRVPADRLSENTRRRLIDLLAGLASHPDTVVRLAVLQRFIDLPLPDGDGRLMRTALASLTAASPDEKVLSARVITANATANDAPAIQAAVAKLRDQRRSLHDFVRVVTAEALANGPMRRRLLRRRWQLIEEALGLVAAHSAIDVFQNVHRKLLTKHGVELPSADAKRFLDAEQLGEFLQQIRRLAFGQIDASVDGA